eukprot:TRINITY_DN2313_c0_g1_i2.p1 TRINITY_DN2313_c0_g1~~TRINITY_DN2313_c0_g1_i2.p1  ORF type:complete len:575 (+),score=218.84 TRINITY_DN2313_c0_g1_i2:112-1725(+)
MIHDNNKGRRLLVGEKEHELEKDEIIKTVGVGIERDLTEEEDDNRIHYIETITAFVDSTSMREATHNLTSLMRRNPAVVDSVFDVISSEEKINSMPVKSATQFIYALANSATERGEYFISVLLNEDYIFKTESFLRDVLGAVRNMKTPSKSIVHATLRLYHDSTALYKELISFATNNGDETKVISASQLSRVKHHRELIMMYMGGVGAKLQTSYPAMYDRIYQVLRSNVEPLLSELDENIATDQFFKEIAINHYRNMTRGDKRMMLAETLRVDNPLAVLDAYENSSEGEKQTWKNAAIERLQREVQYSGTVYERKLRSLYESDEMSTNDLVETFGVDLPTAAIAIAAMGNQGHEDSFSLLEKLKNHPRTNIRVAAYGAMRFVDHESVERHLLDALDEDDDLVFTHAINALTMRVQHRRLYKDERTPTISHRALSAVSLKLAEYSQQAYGNRDDCMQHCTVTCVRGSTQSCQPFCKGKCVRLEHRQTSLMKYLHEFYPEHGTKTELVTRHLTEHHRHLFGAEDGVALIKSAVLNDYIS